MANGATAVLIIGGIVLFMLACAICNLFRSNPLREQRPLNVTSREELELQAAQRKEKNLAASIQRLKATLAAKEVALRDTSDTTALLTSRIQSARDPEAADRAKLVGGDVDSFDARGRAMYGDAWDEGIENGLPLREVFLMSDQEAAELRRLARIQADAARAERAEATSHREESSHALERAPRQRTGAAPAVPKLKLGKLGIGGGPGSGPSAPPSRGSRRHATGGSTSPPPPLAPAADAAGSYGRRRGSRRRHTAEPTALPAPSSSSASALRRSGGGGDSAYVIKFDGGVGAGAAAPRPVPTVRKSDRTVRFTDLQHLSSDDAKSTSAPRGSAQRRDAARGSRYSIAGPVPPPVAPGSSAGGGASGRYAIAPPPMALPAPGNSAAPPRRSRRKSAQAKRRDSIHFFQ